MTDKPWGCDDVSRELFVLLRGGLSPQLETRARAHIEDCAACDAMVQQWATWKAPLEQAAAAPLSADRAAALTDSIMGMPIEMDNAPAPATKPRRLVWLLPVAAAVAIAVLWPRAPLVEVAPAPSALPLVLGNAEEGARIDSDATLGQATIKVVGRTHVEQASSQSPVLRVEQGSVDVQVNPLSGRQELRACTQLTCVRVIGTHFSLARDRVDTVHVTHGIVAVSHADFPDVELVLHAGETFVSPWQNAAPAIVEPKDSPETLMRRAEAHLAKGQDAAARALFDTLQNEYPTHGLAAEAAYAAATVAHGQERTRRLRLYVQRYPRAAFVPDALWLLGTQALQAKANGDAAQAFKKILANPAPFSRRAEVAYLLAGLSDDKDAVALYQRTLDEGASPELAAKAKARIAELQAR